MPSNRDLGSDNGADTGDDDDEMADVMDPPLQEGPVLLGQPARDDTFGTLTGSAQPLTGSSEPRRFFLPLPSQLGLPPLEVRLSAPESLPEDLAWLQESFAFDLGEGVCEQLRGWSGEGVGEYIEGDDFLLSPGALLGVDAESVGGVTSLVQLSTATRACLFRLKPCCADRVALLSLTTLMEDERVGKAGVELWRDAQGIFLDSGGAVRMRGCFDVSPALLDREGQKIGLVKGFNYHFNTNIAKPERGPGGKNWASPVLSRDQLEYAALDAFMVREKG